MNKDITILIVEDSLTQAEQLKHLLEEQGYMVNIAANGRQALSMIQKYHPTLIVSDIIMPEMDGYTFCKEIKSDEKLKHIPVILVTYLSDPKDIIKGLEAGADNFIMKPYNEKYLLYLIQHILANREFRKEESIQMGVEIFFRDQKYFINADRLQILNLLLSTYETAVQKNLELIKTQNELRDMNEQLEKKVEERTAELMEEITERKQAEEKTKGSEAKFRSIFENAGGAIFIADTESGRILECNSLAEKLIGRTRDQIIGMYQSMLHPSGESEKYKEKFTLHVKKGYMTDFEVDVQHKDGRRIPVLINAQTTEISGKKVIVGLFIDITKRKRAEEEIMKKAEEFERFNRLAVGREMRMIELKQKVNELSSQLGLAPPYNLAFLDEMKNIPEIKEDDSEDLHKNKSGGNII